jgi:cysteine-rich repeat protein
VDVFASPTPSSGDLFGASVALSVERVIVGAPLADAAAEDTGRVYVFDRATGALLLTLENPVPGRGDQFGHALAVLGSDLLVGAPLHDGGALDSGAAYVFTASGALRQALPNPAQAWFDHFGFAAAAVEGGFLIGAPGPSKAYLFRADGSVLPAASPLRALAARPLATGGGSCGNGVVEGDEQCDDGNAVDLDDCRTDCTRPICCLLDPLAAGHCDDGNPGTDDVLDPTAGCTSVPREDGSCCSTATGCAAQQQCRVCTGCFLYPWDCCDAGPACVARSPQCVGTECLAGAYCECSGGLTCGAESVPAPVVALFTGACDRLRLEESVAPEAAPPAPAALQIARGHAVSARRLIKKAARLARKLTSRGSVSHQCRSGVLTKIKTVKRAIPRGKRLRRCLLAR